MTLSAAEFSIEITFEDGKISLGGNDFFVKPLDANTSVLLDDERLNLIARIQEVQDEVTK